MTTELTVLLGTALALAFVHTVLGPDHYLPFIVMSTANRWSAAKTTVVTIVCGLGHILSSVVLGLIGVTFGLALKKLVFFESFRGDIAAWLLIAFGLTYFVWGLHRSFRTRPHEHVHSHGAPDEAHVHTHSHFGGHAHPHPGRSTTPWVLFTIFVFGPCEPLIPLLMYPAARSSSLAVVLVAGIFGLTTIATMLGLVLTSFYSLAKLPIHRLERHSHALAGLTILLCGLGIKLLGL